MFQVLPFLFKNLIQRNPGQRFISYQSFLSHVGVRLRLVFQVLLSSQNYKAHTELSSLTSHFFPKCTFWFVIFISVSFFVRWQSRGKQIVDFLSAVLLFSFFKLKNDIFSILHVSNTLKSQNLLTDFKKSLSNTAKIKLKSFRIILVPSCNMLDATILFFYPHHYCEIYFDFRK